jgi:hypothetical protein
MIQQEDEKMNFQAMRDLMDRLTAWRIPGNAAKIYLDGEEVFSYASGYANLETGEKMTPEHMINIYSCSKPATVTAALQLYEKGLFLLDDPLYEFIPEFREMTVKCPDGGVRKAEKPITLRHLFTMTSGFNYRNDLPAFDKARVLTNVSEKKQEAHLPEKEADDYEVGSTTAYDIIDLCQGYVTGSTLQKQYSELQSLLAGASGDIADKLNGGSALWTSVFDHENINIASYMVGRNQYQEFYHNENYNVDSNGAQIFSR